MAEYSASQIQAMQQDAMRRVREMHRQSQGRVNNSPPPVPAAPPEPPPPPPPPPEPVLPPPIPKEEHIHTDAPKRDGLSGLLGGLLPDIKIDEEKALIILMLIILAKNGAQMKLLLALGYLLM